jgi:hypothetical protein
MRSTQHPGDVVLVESRLSKQRSYAVAWRDGRGPACPGKLELRDDGLRLETGRRNGRLRVLALRYDAVAAVRVAYGQERLGGCPTLILERPGKDPVLVATIAGVGSLSELGEALARRTRAFAV